MEERIRVRIGTVLNDNGVDILSEDGGSLLHGLYRVIEQELDRAREEGRQGSWKECEEFYGDMREILRPYHMEAEDYRTTLKRLLKLKTKEDEK
jgi:hypothetical protein